MAAYFDAQLVHLGDILYYTEMGGSLLHINFEDYTVNNLDRWHYYTVTGFTSSIQTET